MKTNLTEYEHCQGTLYRDGGNYYRLHARGRTPNGCWLINPTLVGLSDIDARTGKDVLTGETITLDYGTVSAYRNYINS